MRKTLSFIALVFFTLTIGAQDRFRIMSLNMDQGQDNTLDSIACFILKYNPDVVGLQEMDMYPNRSYAEHEKGRNFIAEMSEYTSMYGIFGRAWRHTGGWDYGNAVLSKNTFVKTENIILPHFGLETRGVIMSFFDFKDKRICFASTHLNYENKDIREAQIKYLKEVLERQEADIKIVCGDFNSNEKGFVLSLMDGWQDALPKNENTFSSKENFYKKMKLDYILYKSVLPIKVINADIICDPSITDHCACFAELEFPNISIPK